MNEYKIREFICTGCGKQVSQHARPNQKYCSLECYRNSNHPQRKTGRNVKCASCGISFYAKLNAIKEKNFCSTTCHHEYQGRNKDIYICKICGKEFKWSPSRASQNPKYCSIKCRNLCPEWKRKAVIEGNLILQNSKKATSTEVAGNKILESIGVKFKTQVLIAEKFTVDVLIEDLKIVIQWDGDYWHGYGEVKDKRQKKRIALDRSQDSYMRKNGYTVIRFWDHEIKNEKEKVFKNIREAIQIAATRK